MQLKFTVYNCGTGYNRGNNDVIGQLNRETVSLHTINDGPGGGGVFSGNPGGAFGPAGLIGGVGVDSNVNAAVAEIKKRFTVKSMIVNMCGWSRGAVTCFKIANALQADASTRAIFVNIFAIDPVPGGSAFNNHMWRQIQMTPNIKMCQVILSQHDRRGLFAPYVPTVKWGHHDIDIMPGDHSTIVEPKGTRVEAFELVKDRAKRFLRARGTTFSGRGLYGPVEILERYAKIAENFDDYAHFASGASRFYARRFKGERILKDVGRDRVAKMLPVKPAFFLNFQHEEVFSQQYPALAREIGLPSTKNFSYNNNPAWVQEFNKLTDVAPLMSKMTLYYIASCLKKQGR